MKTCHVCGCEVDDRELICPDCGATVVKHSGTLSIKSVEDTKKKLNPMGMTVSTGSGLTDILRNESEFDNVDVDDDYFGGSIPIGLSKTVIEDDGKKKNDTGKVLVKVFKILLVLAALYGLYFVVTNYFLNRDIVDSYDEAIEIYIEAINDNDVDKMVKIIPSYLNDQSAPAEAILADMQNVKITRYDVLEVTDLTDDEKVELQDKIKLATTKTANFKEAVTVRVRFYGTTINHSGQEIQKNGEVELIFIKFKDNWLLDTESYKSPDIR
ncbi:MAG: hypothetical protein E7257_01535 [Lachnospiraceae bacterium]|nr:hypothetical protein [Lachnospiraceae bacterium]